LKHLIDGFNSATFNTKDDGAFIIFCSPFIQLLGNLEEIKKNADVYSSSKRDSWDLMKQNAKLGMVT
jgi:hypothetical protein